VHDKAEGMGLWPSSTTYVRLIAREEEEGGYTVRTQQLRPDDDQKKRAAETRHHPVDSLNQQEEDWVGARELVDSAINRHT